MDVSESSGGGSFAAERKLVAVLACEIDELIVSSAEPDLDQHEHDIAGHVSRVQTEVMRHGGMVAEITGATVLAMFGVPRTRDDDAERAVRAALAIRATLTGAGVDAAGQLRAGVGFGEVVIRHGQAGSSSWGEVTGEVVSAAIALKNAAPPGAVLVNAASLRVTERAISYGPARLLQLVGATEPMAVWDALSPRPSSDRAPSPVLGVALVGREGELATLLDRYQRASKNKEPHLVMLVGPAGIGKSRLLAELGQRITQTPEPPRWRAGRAQPHIDGGTLGALVELVKAEAGILDSDQAPAAERKLADTVARLITEPAAIWVTHQLRPLLNVGPSADPVIRRNIERPTDVAAAWRLLLHALASRQPMVLSFEDLHWANDLLLDVVAGLVDPTLASSVPLLVVATARPELLVRRPNWTNEQPNHTTITVGPLPDVDTGRLLEALLAHHGVTGAIDPDLLARVGGNPLFAEEYARLLRDRRGRAEALGVPATVQAVIAARLDTLPSGEKAVLADAAVLGNVAWVGAIAAVGGHDPDDLDAWLHLNRQLAALEQRELLRRVPGSRVAGEVEVAFRHILVREVAYAQLPRAARADRHRRAAAWLEQLAPGRTADQAELLAHHYANALTYAQATGSPTVKLVDQARLALRAAGDHASTLGTEALAARYYTEALALWPADDSDRPELELRAGEASLLGEGTGEEQLISARDGLLVKGDRERAAVAEIRLGQLAYARGQERSPHIDRALALVADAPPSHSKAVVLSHFMMHLLVADRHHEVLEVAPEALAMARALGADHIEAAALGTVGAARVALSDPGGIADLERCVALYEEHHSSAMIEWQNNLAYALAIRGDLQRSATARRAAFQAAERFGSAIGLRWLKLERVADHYWSGRWDEAMQVADAELAEGASGRPHMMRSPCHLWRGRIRLARGQVDGALGDGERALDLAREAGDRQNLDPALAFAARVLLTSGRDREAAQLTDELLESLPGRPLNPGLGVDLPVDLVELDYPTETLDQVLASRWLDAAQSFVARDPTHAADTYALIGSRPDEAYSRLQAARHLTATGALIEANTELAIALTFYHQVGASAHLEEAKRLLSTILSQH